MQRHKISASFRKLLSEKIMDLGNLTIGALVLGQFVSGHEFSLSLFIIGFALMMVCYIISFITSS